MVAKLLASVFVLSAGLTGMILMPEQKPPAPEQKPPAPEQKPPAPEQKPPAPEQKPPAAKPLERVYDEGSVWVLSFIKVKPGYLDDYLRDVAANREKFLDAAQKQGLLLSHKTLVGNAVNPADWDLMFMEEYKNWAAFDGLDAKLDALVEAHPGGIAEQKKVLPNREKWTQLLGDKMLQEIKFRPAK